MPGSRELHPDTGRFSQFLEDRATFIDAYCPNASVMFEAGVQSVTGVTAAPAVLTSLTLVVPTGEPSSQNSRCKEAR